ncbi:MAG: 6-bladed beta-propeller [Bacteroidetes bacterium]|jgi:hypothetical protein|nr:6-bladed beta-propeller [Bacteroidota bacterium]MBT4408506.1 6-bladed beta-propeller [Bacteroidota bacterium]MBT5426052.1 6-bladed beta-propeller [Bacteroidota bacterium]MBT7462432.1 6-bladed beta-propeller [Bacteroidota bacterium]
MREAQYTIQITCRKATNLAALVFAFALILSACTTQQPSEFLTLDIEAGFANQKKMVLSEIADRISYVKLETSPECLIGHGRVLVRGDKVFVMEVQPPVIHVFNLQGEFLYKIDKQGKGPGEYMGMFQWSINPSGSHIAFTDLVYVELYLFTAEGEFVNKGKPLLQWNSGFFLNDEINLSVTTVQMLNRPNYPLVLNYSDQLKQIDTLITRTWHGVDARDMPFPGVPILSYQYNDQLFIREQANDTLFQVSLDEGLIPRVVFNTHGKLITQDALFANDINNYYRLNSFWETDNYLTFTVWYKKKFTLLYYDKKKDELFSLPDVYVPYGRKDHIADLNNDLDGFNYPWSKIDQDQGSLTSIHQMTDLKELEETGFFEKEEVLATPHGKELGELVETSSIEDNPIVRIVYLKN